MQRRIPSCTSVWPVLVLLVFFLLVPTESSALRIELAFDRLPSQQGWSYSGKVPEEGASIFCRVRSFLSTCRKQGVKASYA